MSLARSVVFVLGLGACGESASTGDPDGAMPGDLAVDKAAACASSFGTALTAPYGRLDGKVRAIVPPAHPTCAMANNDHLVLQVDADGKTYRMVVNVQSDRAGSDPNVRLASVDAPLIGPAFAEGWHAPSTMDYVTSLSVHDTAFTPHPMAELVQLVTDQIQLGASVAVYASTSGGGSAHLVHRNVNAQDGAIVLNPTTAPHWLLFSFSTQTF